MNSVERLLNGRARLAVIGLGYVGLPLAQAFARKVNVIGYDKSTDRIDSLLHGQDPNHDIADTQFKDLHITYTSVESDLAAAEVFIVAVPTPIDRFHKPDLTMLIAATETVAKYLRHGAMVVFESSVYPGCTEEECIPRLERISGLRCNADFAVGYSPERINAGDRQHTLANVVKIVSASSNEALDEVVRLYALVVGAGLHRAESIAVAEMSKIIENTQRDVNIALMNEVALICHRLGLSTADVLRAASTKWNFMDFHPGLVGGHCIGVDPYYLDYKAASVGYHTQLINHGRYINDSMGRYVAKQMLKMLNTHNIVAQKARVLLMGLTFKENVADVRNSRAYDIYDELRSYNIQNIDIWDPVANRAAARAEYNIELTAKPEGVYDAVIVAVAHNVFRESGMELLRAHLCAGGVLVDVLGIYPDAAQWYDVFRL